MSHFVRLLSAAALLGLVLGVAKPARADSADAQDETEAPAIVLPAARPTSPPTSDDDAPTQVPHWVHRRRPGLIAAGAATFGASYATAVLLGLATAASGAAEPCSDCGTQGLRAVVPIAGPLLYWSKGPEYNRGSPVWWAVWSGVQAVGAGLLIVGLIGHDVLEWRPRYFGATVHVVPALAPKLGAMSLAVSW